MVCIGVGLAVLVAIYAAIKPYPVDTDASGKVLVEGAKMANDTFKGVGYCTAFLTGWILERRFVKFFYRHFYEEKVYETCSRTAELLCGQPDLCAFD